jgi:predicted MFS family arabinose efflux permease
MTNFTRRYRNYVLGLLLAGYTLNSFDRSILSILLEPIKAEFALADVQLGLLGGLAFAAFYSTLGVPVALWADRWSRRNVLALSVLVWTGMTVLCGFATSFLMLALARIGTAIGEAGGNPTSQSLISSFFTPERRATAFGIFALGAPAGTMLAGTLGGLGSDTIGWRMTFVLAGLPGVLIAPLIFLTITEPGTKAVTSSHALRPHASPATLRHVCAFLWARPAFRHLCVACALHAVALYGAVTFNVPFLNRSHEWSATDSGKLVALIGACGIVGTFLGGFLADRLSMRYRNPAWLLWVPALASLALPAVQLVCYLSNDTEWIVGAFCISGMLGTMFFGPSFATTQALAPERSRTVAASVLILVKTLIGLGLGPLLIGAISDGLAPLAGHHSLRYAMLTAAVFNLWSCVHFLLAARTLRADMAATWPPVAPLTDAPIPGRV